MCGTWRLARRLPPCDHAFANPPFWPGGTAPPEALRRAATHEEASLADWARFLAAPLARRGSLSLILPAARLDAAMAALAAAGCGGDAAAALLAARRAGGQAGAAAGPARRAAARRGWTPAWCCMTRARLHRGGGGDPAGRCGAAGLTRLSRLSLSFPGFRGGAGTRAAHAPRPGFPCCGGGWCPARPGGASASSRGCASNCSATS